MQTREPKWIDANTTHEGTFRHERKLTEQQLLILVMKDYFRQGLVNGTEYRIPNEDIPALPTRNIEAHDQDVPFIKK